MTARCALAFWLVMHAAGDWPMFRGPGGSGIGSGGELPVEFGPGRNVIWKTGLPAGTSSPVIAGNLIYVTGAEGTRLLTIALDRVTGKVLWRAEVERARTEAMHKLNSSASSTPVTDGSNVYAFFGEFGLVSYTHQGKRRWQMPLGPFSNLHGMAASPILAGEKLILVCDQDDGSFVMAVDKDTGKVLWKTDRPEVVHGFATPSLFQGTQVVVPGSYQLTSYSIEDGRKLWWVRGLTWQVKASAAIHGDTVYASGWAPGVEAAERLEIPPFDAVLKEGDSNGDGRLGPSEVPAKWKHGGGWNFIDLDRDGTLDGRDWSFYRARRSAQNVTMAVRPGSATGDLTGTHVLWRTDRSVPVVSTPLVYEGFLYTIKDGGILTSLNAADGKIRKQARLTGAIDSYYASPVAGDNKIFLVSEAGKVSVVKPGAEWEILAVNDLNEPGYATPAISDSRIYIRTAGALYCFGNGTQ